MRLKEHDSAIALGGLEVTLAHYYKPDLIKKQNTAKVLKFEDDTIQIDELQNVFAVFNAANHDIWHRKCLCV